MPATEIRVFRGRRGETPLLEWLDQLARSKPRAYAKCLQRIRALAEQGSELRRPIADYLRDGVYELRAKAGSVNYRILYGFIGKNVACLSHGLTKEAAVPNRDIEAAIDRLRQVTSDPVQFTADMEF